jgi:hypothetical protein
LEHDLRSDVVGFDVEARDVRGGRLKEQNRQIVGGVRGRGRNLTRLPFAFERLAD